MSGKEDIINRLKKRVKEIKDKAAKDQTDEVITQNITDIFNGFKWDEKSKTPNAETTAFNLIFKCIKLTAVAVLALLLLSLCVYMATQNNPYLSRTVKNAMHERNMAYSIARAMRFISMPFHKFIDMKRAQKWECLVRNPFYKADEPNCEACEVPLDILSFPATAKESKEASSIGEPVIIKGEKELKHAQYNYSFIRNFYHSNKEKLDFSLCETYGDEGNKKLEHYFARTEEEFMESKSTFGWSNCRIEGTRVLRKLFRRPSFVPLMSEIFLEKHLYIIHPESPRKLELPPCGTENCFMAQVHGSSAVTLIPFDGCKKNCTRNEETEVQPGEIFYYPGQPWKVVVEALGNKMSIIYRSDFT